MTDNPQPESLLHRRGTSRWPSEAWLSLGISASLRTGKVCLIVIIGGLYPVYGPVLGSFFVVIVAGRRKE